MMLKEVSRDQAHSLRKGPTPKKAGEKGRPCVPLGKYGPRQNRDLVKKLS